MHNLEGITIGAYFWLLFKKMCVCVCGVCVHACVRVCGREEKPPKKKPTKKIDEVSNVSTWAHWCKKYIKGACNSSIISLSMTGCPISSFKISTFTSQGVCACIQHINYTVYCLMYVKYNMLVLLLCDQVRQPGISA